MKNTKENRRAILKKQFAEFGKRLVFVAIDDFYLDKEENARRAAAEGREAEHESVKSIDLDALAEFAREIEMGEKGSVPRFRSSVSLKPLRSISSLKSETSLSLPAL